jgi:hypothetical protein
VSLSATCTVPHMAGFAGVGSVDTSTEMASFAARSPGRPRLHRSVGDLPVHGSHALGRKARNPRPVERRCLSASRWSCITRPARLVSLAVDDAPVG